jgi:histidine ammonia-lyase
MILLERHDQLDLALFRKVALGGERLELASKLLSGVDRDQERLVRYLEAGGAAYGVNTGLGYLSARAIDPPDQEAFQRAILVGRAAGLGPPLSEPAVRGAMLLRLTGFLSGYPGVSAALCQFIADRLNDGWFPIVPAGVTGAAGEIVPLAHLFGTFVGEGLVQGSEGPIPAADALAARGVEPHRLGAKEGIALINGAPLAPALAVLLALRADALLIHATLAGALAIALTGASRRPYSARVGALKGDPGQQLVHAQLGELLAGGGGMQDASQAPVSLRVIPQVHGAAHDLLDHLYGQLDRELRAVTDSPVFLTAAGDEPEGLYSTGNFHAQAITLCLEALGVGLVQVLNLIEKRLHRLLDSRFTGLPEQLAHDPGRQSGLVILHKQVIGLVAEARTLAPPASVHMFDGSTGQEDFQAHTVLVARQLERICAGLELGLAHELVAQRQAFDLGPAELPPRLACAIAAVAEVVPPITEDRALAGDVARVRALIAGGGLVSGAPRWAPLLLAGDGV